MDVEKLLIEWGFPNYVDVFKENKVDAVILKFLTFDTLSTLVPPVGDRIKILKKIEDLNDLNNNQEIVDVVVDISEDVLLGEANGESHFSKINEPALVVTGGVDDLNYNIVAEYLRCPKGERIKNNYFGTEKNPVPPESQQLDVTHQNLLCDLIVNAELKTSTTEINASRFVTLAQNIEKIFPNEKQGIYFIPYSSVKLNGKVVKKINCQGKLWWKYTNVCRSLISDGARIPRKKKKKESPTVSAPPESVAGILLWLEGQLEINENLQKKWKETAVHRYNLLLEDYINCPTLIKRSGKCLINSYFLKYPFLRQPGGYSLLEQDFLERYPQCENKLFDKWPQFKEKVLTFPGKINTSDRNISDAGILLKFCNLVTDRLKTKRVCSKWVANADEITEGFLLHIKTIDSCHAEIERITKRAVSNKLHVSPFAIVVGLDIESITDAYIYIDGVRFRVASPLHAIDQTFKAIHALHAVYQQQSTSIWLLLQRTVYELNTVWDQSCSVVESLLPKLG